MGKRKLTEINEKEIFELRRKVKVKDLSQKYGVSKSTISKIWRHGNKDFKAGPWPDPILYSYTAVLDDLQKRKEEILTELSALDITITSFKKRML